MDTTNKRRMQVSVFAVAAVTLTSGLTQAQTGVNPTKTNHSEYASPIPCNQDDVGGRIPNPVQVVNRCHYPVFDAFQDCDVPDGHLSNNLCPPSDRLLHPRPGFARVHHDGLCDRDRSRDTGGYIREGGDCLDPIGSGVRRSGQGAGAGPATNSEGSKEMSQCRSTRKGHA